MLPFAHLPLLETDALCLVPLQASYFAELYAVAADPQVWAQHPSKDRWQPGVFRTFFEGALQSGGAYKIVDKATGATLGSTRFYNYQPAERRIQLGYTFYGTQSWGKGINPAVKTLLLDYIFKLVETVHFDVGATNVRSQIAIQRLGARKVTEQELAYYGEPPRLNYC